MRSLLVLCLLVSSTYALTLGKTVIDPTLNWRVVGGSNAPDGAYPHQVSIRSLRRHICGGSIIDAEWVITAAHCLTFQNLLFLKVAVGSNKLTEGVLYKVIELHVHEKYNSSTGLNDVAIMKVKKMEFNEKVNKIALETEDVAGDVPVILSGWGDTSWGSGTPNDLQHVNLKTTSVQQCKDAHVDERPVEATQICTFTKVGEGSCFGDSGGPLITTDDNGNRKVVGIVSWGRPCAEGFPDVFVRVSSYVDWFKKKCNCV